MKGKQSSPNGLVWATKSERENVPAGVQDFRGVDGEERPEKDNRKKIDFQCTILVNDFCAVGQVAQFNWK